MRQFVICIIVLLAGCSDERPSAPSVSTPSSIKDDDAAPSILEEFKHAIAAPHQINTVGADGKTFLIRAIEQRHADSVQALLENGALPDLPGGKGATPIFIAVLVNDGAILDLLSKHSAKLEVPHFGGKFPGITLLHLAASRGADVSVKWLLSKGAQVDATDSNGETPLLSSFASPRMKWELLEHLLKAGAEVNHQNKHGKTAMDIAIHRGELKIARKLSDVGGKTSPGEPTLDDAWPREPSDPPHPVAYLERQSKFRTRLLVKGPAPAEGKAMPPEGVREILYKSGDLELNAWLYQSKKVPANSPVLVYLHGGFELDESDVMVCKPFIDEGFTVLLPSYRGENGNPGNYELLCGEIDDAAAAIAWIAAQPYVDSNRIYVFGHSVGGGVSDLLSLRKELPIRHGASCGGLYTPVSLILWKLDDGIIPFDTRYFEEFELRSLLPHIEQMQRVHHAFVGDSDQFSGHAYLKRMEGKDSKLKVIQVSGDHQTSLPVAITEYLKIATRDAQ